MCTQACACLCEAPATSWSIRVMRSQPNKNPGSIDQETVLHRQGTHAFTTRTCLGHTPKFPTCLLGGFVVAADSIQTRFEIKFFDQRGGIQPIVWICIYMYIYIYIYETWVYIFICIHKCVYAYISVYIYIYILSSSRKRPYAFFMVSIGERAAVP